MDAQHSGNDRCQQHLQRDRNPADKQTHRNTTCDRASIEVPHHWLSKGIACPGTQGIRVCFRPSQMHMQLATYRMGVGQSISQPVTGHSSRPCNREETVCNLAENIEWQRRLAGLAMPQSVAC